MREKIMRAGHLEVALRRAKACAAGFFVASVGMHSSAAEAPWKFDPPKVGHALSEGGWSVGYEIGSVSASPEFTFPIQLVYLNGRTERGVFGGGWICPQLDTRVIPRESGIFVWQMPSGGMMGFRQDRKDGRIYRGLSGGGWQATVAGPAQEIWNEEGWRFRYERSRPVSIISPGGRSLIFIWKAKRLVELRLSAGAPGPAASAPGLTVLRAAYSDGDDRLRGLEIQGQVSRFDHAAGKDGPVTAWTPPVGARVVFGYSKAGQLASTQMEKGDREDFRTAFFVSGKGERADRSRLANWWLVQDRNFAYAYGKNKKGFPQPTLVTITDRAGRSRSLARLDGGMQVAESVGRGRARHVFLPRPRPEIRRQAPDDQGRGKNAGRVSLRPQERPAHREHRRTRRDHLLRLSARRLGRNVRSRARSYDVELSRWRSFDPHGFPDGANGSIYAPIPSCELDPTGLWKVKLVSITPQNGQWSNSAEWSRDVNHTRTMTASVNLNANSTVGELKDSVSITGSGSADVNSHNHFMNTDTSIASITQGLVSFRARVACYTADSQ